jgi:alpha-amylase
MIRNSPLRNFAPVLFGLLLISCTSKAVAIQPVRGLPQGTDGFAWWNDTVFYEIFVRSFYDSNGDGIGDLNGIIEKLDYLNDGDQKKAGDLGVTGIWLMPINPSPSYHGYDVTNYYAVNSDYGTLDDFKRLLEECHKRGIRVIMDLVLNHTSTQNAWFVEARDKLESTRNDWYIWSETNPGYLGPWDEQVWYPSTAGYYYAIFWVGMPDLNYTNSDVTNEMYNVARYWLQDVGVDGFRLDAARYLIEEDTNQADTSSTHEWWADFRPFYKEINSQAMTVAEIWTTNYSVVNYVEGDELDMAFNFDLATQMMRNVGNRNASNMGASIQSSNKLFNPGTYATFLTNHDMERVMSAFMEDQDKAKLAASVLLTAPGTPFIYYGEEIGMTGDKPDENIRTPMLWSTDKYAGFSTVYPWKSVNRNYEESNVEIESSDPNSLLSLYRTLIGLRNEHAALRVGDYYNIHSDNLSIMPFLRVSKEETLMVLINMSRDAISGYEISLAQGPLSGTYHVYPVLGEGNLLDLMANENGGFDSYQPGVEIPANGLLLIQLRGR